MANKKTTSKKGEKTEVRVSNARYRRVEVDSNGKKGSSRDRSEQKFEPIPESTRFIHQFMPYILIVSAIFLAACFILSGIEGAMGDIGRFLRDFFCGLFGLPAFILPLILIHLAVYWRKYVDLHMVPLKITLSCLAVLLISALLHVCTIPAINTELYTWGSFGTSIFGTGEAISNWTYGVDLIGGGFFGGLLGGLFRCAVGFVGSMILLIASIAICIMFLFSVTPAYVWGKTKEFYLKCRDKYLESAARKAEERAAAEAEKKDDSEDEEEEPLYTEPPRKRRRRVEPIPDSESSDVPFYEQIPEPVIEPEPAVATTEVSQPSNQTSTPPLRPAEEIDDPDELGGLVDNIFYGVSNPAPAPDRAPIKTSRQPLKANEPEAESDGIVPPNAAKNKKEMQQLAIYSFPPITLLKEPTFSSGDAAEAEISKKKQLLHNMFASFNVRIDRIEHSRGPTITRYELYPSPGVKANAITALQTDISMVLQSKIKMEVPIPGKSAIGIEVPNKINTSVSIRELLDTDRFRNASGKLFVCLGKDISGGPVYMDIDKLPHLLIAGTTGSGKSVCINAIIVSLLYKARPDEVQFIMIDPKKVELSMYNKLPHLRVPVVTDSKKAAGTLNAAVNEMERRYELCEAIGVRKLDEYNAAMKKSDPDFVPIPKLVIIIDELADLMLSAPTEIETSIVKIAQKARAAGIHLIVGTQRPSVDVITGLIKANMPSRIAFAVASSTDARTIIDSGGADKLLGRGDMLYAPAGSLYPTRAQGVYVSDEEIIAVTDFIKNTSGNAVYDKEFINMIEEEADRVVIVTPGKKPGADTSESSGAESFDPLFTEALQLAVENRTIATSFLQRSINVGFGRGARIMDRMAKLGFISPADGQKARQVYLTAPQLAELIARNDPRVRGIIPPDPPADDDGAPADGENV